MVTSTSDILCSNKYVKIVKLVEYKFLFLFSI